ATTAGLLKSKDGGNTWAVLPVQTPAPSVTDLAVDPGNALTIWAVTGLTAVQKSTDGGNTFAVVLSQSGARALAVAPSSANVLYLGSDSSSGAQALRSSDGGATWTTQGQFTAFNNRRPCQ